MELLLKINRKQLKVFTDLADKLNIKYFVIDEKAEDEAVYNAMQDGNMDIVEEQDQTDFENWVKK